MNKILVFAEKKSFEGIFRGLYGSNGFQVRSFTLPGSMRITPDDNFIIVFPDMRFEPVILNELIDKTRMHVPDLSIICVSAVKSSAFRKKFIPAKIDAYFTEKMTLPEIEEGVRKLMFPERYQVGRSEVRDDTIREVEF